MYRLHAVRFLYPGLDIECYVISQVISANCSLDQTLFTADIPGLLLQLFCNLCHLSLVITFIEPLQVFTSGLIPAIAITAVIAFRPLCKNCCWCVLFPCRMLFCYSTSDMAILHHSSMCPRQPLWSSVVLSSNTS